MSKFAKKHHAAAAVLVVPVLCFFAWYLLISPNYPDGQTASALPNSDESLNLELDSSGIEIVSSNPAKVRVEGIVAQYLFSDTYVFKSLNDKNFILVLGDTKKHNIGDVVNLSGELNFMTPANMAESSGLSYGQILVDATIVNKYLYNPVHN